MPVESGLLLDPTPQGILYASRYVGEPNIPGEVKRRRRSVYDLMRRMGTPILWKHRYNDEDVQNGIATKSPAFDDVYGHSPSYDAISHGVGYCSVELSEDEWFNTTTGEIVRAWGSPGVGYLQAPRYRGYGPGHLVYIIEPDTALDFWRLSPTGALIRVQSATAVAPWFPEMNDNDLLINVELDAVGNIIDTAERYELKMVNPVSLRGRDRRGRRESGVEGNRFLVNQSFEMAMIPKVGSQIYEVEVDR